MIQCTKISGKLTIPHPLRLKEKILHLENCGPSNLQVVTDFDQTLTRYYTPDNLRADSTFKALIDWSGTSEQVKMEASQYF
jgi:hypothetical protein